MSAAQLNTEEAVLRELTPIWSALPFEAWDCAPGTEWENAAVRLATGLSQLRRFLEQRIDWTADWLRFGWGSALGQAMRSLREGMDTRQDRLLPHSGRKPAVAYPHADLGHLIGLLTAQRFEQDAIRALFASEQARLFLRAGAQAGDPLCLARFLAHYQEAHPDLDDDLIRHLAGCCHTAPTPAPPRPPMDGPGHRVFHALTPSEERGLAKALQVFEGLVDVPLPLMGQADGERLSRAIAEQAPWMTAAGAALRRQVDATLLGWQGLTLKPLLLVGPPGCGKSWLAQRLGEWLGLPCSVIAAGGQHDNMALKGAARGWSSARAGRVVEFIARQAVANPLIIVDEIDKASESTRNGNLLQTLLQLIEPENARHWHDEFLLGRCDLSRVSWIATANAIAHLPRSLLSRFQVVEVPAPGPEHRPAMLHSVLRELERETQPGHAMHQWLGEAQWRVLERHATTPRKARQLVRELLALQVQACRAYPH